MPFLIVVLLIILIAQFGFWDTLQGVLGAAAMMAGFVVLLVALVATAGWYAVRRLRNRLRPPSLK